MEPEFLPANHKRSENSNENNHNQNFDLNLIPSKPTPVGLGFHQIEVPLFAGSSTPLHSPNSNFFFISDFLESLSVDRQPQSTFLARKTNPNELQEYLSFAENYFEDKIPEYFTQSN